MKRVVFVSLFAYALGKETDDPEQAVRAEIEAGLSASWPGFRTLHRVRTLAGPIVLYVSHSSLIAKARSLACGAFFESGADVWVSIDDDIDASEYDVEILLSARDVDVLIAPCALRGTDTPRLNVVTPRSALETPLRELSSGARVFPVEYGGLALSLVTREAASALYRAHPELRFINDTDNQRGLAVFLERVDGGAWYGEDFAFCARARAEGLRVEALCDTRVTHAGVLATVDSASLGGVNPYNPYTRDEPPPPAPPPAKREDAPPPPIGSPPPPGPTAPIDPLVPKREDD